MKKFFFLCMAVVAMTACSDDSSTEGSGNNSGGQTTQASLAVSPTNVDFSTDGGTGKVTITSTAAWTAEFVNDRADDWCSIDSTSGSAGTSTLTITATANDTPDDRTASIVVKSGTLSKTINVSQKQKDALTVTSSKFEVDAEGGEVVVEVKANIDFEYAIDESAKDWISYEGTRAIQTSTLVFKVAKNDDTEKREGKITIKSGEFSEEVTVYQAGEEPSIVISQNEYTVSSDGETIAVEVSSNVDVAVELPTDIDWIKESTTRVTSTNTYYFDITKNEDYDQRSAEIKFTNKENNLSEVITITQAQKDAIVLAKSEYELGVEGGNLDFEIQTNVDITVTISDNAKDWITQIETRGLQSKTLHFNITTNDSDNDREGTITLSGGIVTQTITLKQTTMPIYIPDTTFKAYCIENFDSNNDGEISISEARNVTNIEIYSIDIESLEGIEHFPELEYLTIRPIYDADIAMGFGDLDGVDTGEWRDSGFYNNGERTSGKLSAIDVSKNVKLLALDVAGNIITSIDLSKNTELFYFNAMYNLDFANVKFAANSNLNTLYLTATSITNIDLSTLKNLEILNIDRGAGLESLDISRNNKLKRLDISRGKMETIDVSNNIELEELSCYLMPMLQCLNLSNNVNLTKLSFGFSNKIRSIDLSNNTKLEELYFQNANLNNIDVSMLPNLTNIYFGNYQKGNVIVNTIKDIDLSQNLKLKNLYAPLLDLEKIDISKNVEIEAIDVYGNLFHNLDVSFNPILKGLNAGNNPNLLSIYITPEQQFTYIIDPHTQFVYKGEEVSLYESTDYSKDGEVKQLQTATKGDGIDIVLMGDAYSDRLIADGTYEQTMQTAMEKFFEVEPYKSFRDHFNVYSVTAVSKNEVYNLVSSTALAGYFGGGTLVGGNDQRAFYYAKQAIGEERMDEALIVVMMNSTAYAGTCYMYNPTIGDYGDGVSVSYFPVGEDTESLGRLIHHEAAGHGFSKLGDEYAYENMGAIPESEITSARAMAEYGWWKNIDFTNDPTKVKWNHFLTDSRYTNDGLGVYEGAFTYWTGAYRPTQNSIMNTNVGGFNAPSRESIYYRIHKLAYGEDWKYDYEEFVEYDAINRTTAATTRGIPYRLDIPEDFKPLHPPVVVNDSWRNAKNNAPKKATTSNGGNEGGDLRPASLNRSNLQTMSISPNRTVSSSGMVVITNPATNRRITSKPNE